MISEFKCEIAVFKYIAAIAVKRCFEKLLLAIYIFKGDYKTKIRNYSHWEIGSTGMLSNFGT